jgi:hypothetical protein
MLPLYISVFLLNWLLEDVINFVKLFRGKQARALAKVQYLLLVFVITLAGGRDKHNVYIAHLTTNYYIEFGGCCVMY